MKIENLPYRAFIVDGRRLAERANEALEWLERLGLANPAGRYSQYKREVERFGAQAEGDVPAGDRLHRFLNAQAELFELVRVYRSMQEIDSDDYLETLKKVTSGVTFRNEAKQDPARDFLFELALAARMITAGFPVDLGHLADVVAVIEGRRVYIEAKRIRALGKLSKRIKEASDQIGRRLARDKSRRSRGLIAINITDLINPGNRMVVHDDIYQLKDLHAEELHNFVRKRERIIDQGQQPKRLGVLAEYTLQGVIAGTDDVPPKIFNCRGASLKLFNVKAGDEAFVRRFSPRLANQFVAFD